MYKVFVSLCLLIVMAGGLNLKYIFILKIVYVWKLANKMHYILHT